MLDGNKIGLDGYEAVAAGHWKQMLDFHRYETVNG